MAKTKPVIDKPKIMIREGKTLSSPNFGKAITIAKAANHDKMADSKNKKPILIDLSGNLAKNEIIRYPPVFRNVKLL